MIYYLIIFLLYGYYVVYHYLRQDSPPSTADSASANDQVEELKDDEFYHHPAWPQRWSHPDFTDEAMVEWGKEPWYREKRRLTCQFLRSSSPSQFPWGYIIYRTVYTPESDELWPIAMERLTRFMNDEIDYQMKSRRRKLEEDSRPEQLVKESHKDVIISDKKRWDGASIEQIREHFAAYLRATGIGMSVGMGRFGGCLVIDERSLKSIVATLDPDSRRESGDSGPLGFVGLVDGRYKPEIKYDKPSYKGFMRVEIDTLWYLYVNLDMVPTDEVCPGVRDGLIPVYDGGDGKAHDEDGNEHPRYRSRPPGSAEGRGGRGSY